MKDLDNTRGAGELPLSLRVGLSKAELPGLNGIRAIAAFLVVFYHFGLPVSGGLGVLIFFVLSGFLITWLLLGEEARTSTISIRKFYARRTLRIFPAFYVYWLAFIAILLVRGKTIHWAQAVCSFFYVNNYYQAILGDPNTGLSHTWSLAIEEQFYLLWPMTLLVLFRNRQRMASKLMGMIAILWVYRYVMKFGFHVWQGYVYEAFDMRADHLLIGCLLAVSLRFRLFPRVWDVISNSWAPGLLAIAGLAFCSFGEMHWGSSFRDPISFIVSPILSAVVIVSAIAFSGRGFWRALNWNWVQYLGRISYSIYLYQQMTIEAGSKFTAHYPMLVRLTAAVSLTMLAATCSYFIVERPFLYLKARFASSPPPQSSISAVLR